MVISVNPKPTNEEFSSLLSKTIEELNSDAVRNPNIIKNLKGAKLEPYVRDLMTDIAKGTKFEDSIELIGGQKFPDIIAKKYYGIEVKTTTQNHWKTTGNSVLESTRVEEVERIHMLFGKLADPIEFKSRPYEECLSEVVVTHSPRYLIDMDLAEGNTIFDKIDISYDILRNKENPIKPITEYYKSKLKPGQDIWWINNDDKASNLIIDVWSNLSLEKRHSIKIKSMALYPELFSNKQDKFSRIAIWLVTEESIVCPNLRDVFTAGGQDDYMINGEIINKVPRVFINLFNELDKVVEIILKTPSNELSHYWNIKTDEKNKLKTWIELIYINSQTLKASRGLNLKKILHYLIFKK